MNEAISTIPRWMLEFRRFEPLKSQFFFYGNVYDCYFFPTNYLSAMNNADLKWARFGDIRALLQFYLKSEGYELICNFDTVDKISVESTDGTINKANILKFIGDENKVASTYFGSRTIETFQNNLCDTISFFRYLVSNKRKLSAGIIHFASRFASNPNLLTEEEAPVFIRLVKAAQEACVFPDKSDKRNMLIFICDKLNDIPSWVLLENPLVKGIEIKKPSREERKCYFNVQSGRFCTTGEPFDQEKTATIFSDLTEGLFHHQLENIATISRLSQLHVNRMREVVDLFKYGTKENFWETIDKNKLDNAENELKNRVLGQDAAIKKVLQIVRCAKHGLNTIEQKRQKCRPKGVLFFAGPTGVGKTELAKSLAELIFNDEDALIRLDMSEYNAENSDVKLIGAPPGYVGYEEGGQLASAVKSKPFSIVLFDEIEKAHPVVFDKFLQMLDDGRLTDGRGETTYFSETLIIFTSNLGMTRKDPTGRPEKNVDYEHDDYKSMCSKIMDEVNNYFAVELERPEILNRFGDNFVVFDFIKPQVGKAILEKNLLEISDNLLKRKNCDFQYDQRFIDEFMKHYINNNLKNGGRGIRNRIDTFIKQGIADLMSEGDRSDGLKFRAFIDEADGMKVRFECI